MPACVTTSFETGLKAAARATEAALERFLGPAPEIGEAPRPGRLVEAMRYAALGPGKRLRPFLLIQSASLFAVPQSAAVAAGAALECIHAYSLVHDDLPAMDDDDMRRGRPTVHRAFDEATAILAGDALLTIAFDILGRLDVADAVRAELVVAQARAAGAGGMVGGQVLDLTPGTPWGEASLRAMQAMKTGALFVYAAEAGAILGAADPAARASLRRFGRHFGAAFQLADDLDDAEKDAASGRPSLAALLGPEAAREALRAEADAAIACLEAFGARAEALVGATRFVSRLS
jgi:farnesyl diphosphate synthase